MGNPDLSRKGYSPKRNRENLNAFLINAAHILKGEEVEKIISKKQKKGEEEFWEESELSAINTLQRISAYVLIILFTILSIYLISQFEIKSTIISLTILYFCFSYIYYDLKIINLKNKKNSKKVK